ncbi:MAG: DUF5050 domain-containing protein [Bacillota bacterium]
MSTEKVDAKNPKLMLLASSVVLIILIVVLALKLGGNSTTQTSGYITENLNKPVNIDFNIKNSMSSGMLGATNEYIFYSDNKGLYRINKDGSNKVELDSGEISNINIYNGSLYYSKFTPDGNTIQNRNKAFYIVKQSLEGTEKTEVTNVSCQRINSMLVVNDIIVHELVVFDGDGGKNELGEPTGKLVSKYKAISVDGQHSGDVPKDKFEKLMMINYPYNQSDLDTYLRDGYPNVVVKSSKYSVEDKMFFEAHSIKNPKYAAIFTISKKDDKLNMIAKYEPESAGNTPASASVIGFSYSDKTLYYMVSERKRSQDAKSLEEKLDLYKLDVNNNTPVLINTVYKSEGF